MVNVGKHISPVDTMGFFATWEFSESCGVPHQSLNGCNDLCFVLCLPKLSRQFMATSAEVTTKGSLVRESYPILHPWRLTWNMSSWRFGSDHVPFFSWAICRFQCPAVNLPGCKVGCFILFLPPDNWASELVDFFVKGFWLGWPMVPRGQRLAVNWSRFFPFFFEREKGGGEDSCVCVWKFVVFFCWLIGKQHVFLCFLKEWSSEGAGGTRSCKCNLQFLK